MRIDLGETENHAYERAKEATSMLLALLIEHHGDGSEILAVDDRQVELLECSEPVPDDLASDEAWIKRQIALHPKPWFYVTEELGPLEEQGLSVQQIQRAVLIEFPIVTLRALNSDTRTQAVVRPRQIAMYLAKSLTTRSLPDIGRRFGGRDHTTVLHAVRKIAGLIQSDPLIASQVERIKGSLAEATA